MKFALLSVVLGLPGWAADWEKSFPPEPTQAALPSSGVTVMVVAAGRSVGDARRASEALSSALRAGGKAELVMDDSALGPLGDASDEVIRQRAQAVSWDVLVVVRIFDSAPGEPPVAVASLYDRQGKGIGSLKGRAINRVSSPASESATPQAALDDRLIHFGQKGLVTSDKATLLYAYVYRGKRKLTEVDLFGLLARPDFDAALAARGRTRLALGLGGFGIFALGAVGYFASATSPCVRREGFELGTCLQTAFPNLRIPSIGVAIAGVGLAVASIALPSNPLSAPDVLRAIEQYNAALPFVRLVPEVDSHGARLAVVGRF